MRAIYKRKFASGDKCAIDYRLPDGQRIREIVSADKTQAKQG
jgi:hypothetical protein